MKIWIAATTLLSACAAGAGGNGDIPEAGAGPCDADAAQSLVGEAVSAELGQRAMALSGARDFRWIPPDSAVTMDYRPGRLNVEYDRAGTVTAIRCG